MARYLTLLLALLFCSPAFGQSTSQATTGMPAVQLSGTGGPVSKYDCTSASSAYANLSYIQTDATNGRLWLCVSNTAGTAWAWSQQILPIKGSAVTGTFSAATYLLNGCSSILTVTIAGAAVGTNSATASPIYATAPTNTNPGQLNLTAWVSAANTVSVQACAIGTILTTTPAFTANVILY